MFSRLFSRANRVSRSKRTLRTNTARNFGLGTALVSTTLTTSFFANMVLAEVNYDAIKEDIMDILDDENYDDGSYGPVFVRLAWHSSGTYNKHDGTGGSDGATMRFSPEKDHGANAGLEFARAKLEAIKSKYPEITYADLWSLAGAVAIETLGGPEIDWRPGRSDKPSGEHCTPDGRLPDGAQGSGHLRDIFYRMGFNDKDIVALAGAHALGRCHTDRSGFKGPWTRSPTTFSNAYYQELMNNEWTLKKWDGPAQFEDPTGDLMMLPADISLKNDPKFRKYVTAYAKDEDLFFKDFAVAFKKLQELGVKF
eukprot:TRINITY_DN890_c0_g1_i1.p1 TRINITY_DN890_c0_g1~~TRINITY_DN890_c0_g1_i1.p1  ORF type:complete len:310 (-),score=86.04 TRINITY_DN890_c0_g1_i1:36-965(-)